ncbi:MAG: hypothetical protein ACRC0Y_02325 [Fusobacteriaceae bacterium]
MKKALILFGNEINTENLIKNAIYLKEKFNFSLSGLYIDDIRNQNIMTQGIDGAIYDTTTSRINEELIKFRQEEVKEINKKLIKYNSNMEITLEVGLTEEILKNAMKNQDLLILGKGETLSSLLLETLKANYKSVLIAGDKLLDFSKIYIANDDGVKVNRSCYQFFNLFPQEKLFKVVEINDYLEENILLKYLKDKEKKYEEIKVPDKESLIKYFSEEEKTGLLIMGNLSKSYFLEKITGKKGFEILEKSKLSVFIG